MKGHHDTLDDILLVWTHGRQLLLDFIAYLNSLHPTIKLTSNIDSNSVDFLDVTVFKGTRFQKHRTLDSRTFFKSTNSFHYLAIDSFLINCRQVKAITMVSLYVLYMYMYEHTHTSIASMCMHAFIQTDRQTDTA